MSMFARDDSPRGLTREDVMKAADVAALFAVPVSTVLRWGLTGVLTRISSAATSGCFRADIERLVREQDDDSVP
jgi:hypothetical protein